MAPKAICTKCLHGARISTTGVSPRNTTLRMDMGGAVLYVMPKSDGSIEVSLDSQNLIDGDYAYCIWDDERWIISDMKDPAP